MPHLAALSTGWAMFLLDVTGMALFWPAAVSVWVRTVAPSSILMIAAATLYPALNLVALYALGLYRRDVVVEIRRSLGRIPLVTMLGAAGAAGALALGGLSLTGDEGPIPLVVVAATCFLAAGISSRVGFDALRRYGLFSRRLLIVGAGRRAWDLVWVLRHEGLTLGYTIAFVHDPAFGGVDPRLADGSAGEILPIGQGGFLGVARQFGADQLVVAPDERRGLALEGLLACKIAGYPVQQYLSFVEREVRRVDLKRMDLSWLLYSDGFHFGAVDRFAKRLLDLLVSLLLLLLLSPILLAVIAAIKLGDGGPVFYHQERVTRNGRVFSIRKLRTMRVNAETGGAVWAAQGDDRITWVGAFLRRSRVDELPQIINILHGDMSFVGPRPERPAFIEQLAREIPLYHERHIAKAGLTGWAQVNYPYGASVNDARSKLSYDLYYIKNFSVLFDLLIIVQTIRVVLWPGGVR